MAKITANTKKEFTLRNEIKSDEKIVAGQTATINSETKKLSLSKYVNDYDLYEKHYDEIVNLMNEFEREAFAEKNRLVAEGE